MRYRRKPFRAWEWRGWFAWQPVVLEENGDLVWLERIERKWVIHVGWIYRDKPPYDPGR